MTALIKSTDTLWPYSTHDDVSHLVMTDVHVLRDRIDMLLEERREWLKSSGMAFDIFIPREWQLTPGEDRVLTELARLPQGAVATKDRLHAAFSGENEPDTAIKIVDVIICKIRRKLELAGIEEGAIETVWGRGYILSTWLRNKLRQL